VTGRFVRIVIAAVMVWGASPDRASAQWLGRTAPHGGSREISGGASWTNGFGLGDASANETRNITAGTGAFTLFTTSSRVAPAAGADGRFGVYLTRTLAVEAGMHYARPHIRTLIANDAEGADSITATEGLARYIFDGSIVWHLSQLTFAGSRGVPFLLGGAGYLRELHEGNQLVETGREYHAGAGFKYWFSDRRTRVGLRADAQVSMRKGGADPATTRRTVPSAGLSLAYLF
jgi:hypothetical protein